MCSGHLLSLLPHLYLPYPYFSCFSHMAPQLSWTDHGDAYSEPSGLPFLLPGRLFSECSIWTFPLLHSDFSQRSAPQRSFPWKETTCIKYKYEITATVTPFTFLLILSTDHCLSLYCTSGCVFIYVYHAHWNVSPMRGGLCLLSSGIYRKTFASSYLVIIYEQVNFLPTFQSLQHCQKHFRGSKRT